MTPLKKGGVSKQLHGNETDHFLHHLAFDNSLQANIITTASTGKITTANKAACQLLGYSKKELLTKSRSTIFDITESNFKKLMKERAVEGRSTAKLTVLKKKGKPITCEVTSAVFLDENGIEKSITTITDMSPGILEQKNIDIGKEKIVADNIVLAETNQKKIDAKKEKIVAKDILLALKKSDARLAENNQWIKYIAKTSYDVMWDWDISSNRIYVGDSIKEVFGYKVQNNTVGFMDFTSCLLPEEKDDIEARLFKTLGSASKSWNDSYMFKRHDGSIASTTSRASIVRGEDGKAIRLIGAIQDITSLEELKKQLTEQVIVKEKRDESYALAAKLSFDGIWDWNLLTNEFFLGEGFEELFGYSFNHTDNKAFDWSERLHPDDKEVVKKSLQEAIASSAVYWEQAYRFVKTDGSIVNVFGRASIIRSADGKAARMIGVVHDLSRQKELEEKLEMEIAGSQKLLTDYKENFKIIFNSSPDVIFDSDLVTNEVIISDAYEKEFGYKITSHMTAADNWVRHIHPEDKEAVMKDYFRMLAGNDTEWNYKYRFLKADNSVANVLSTCVIMRDTGGKAYRMLGSIRDISKQIVLEERLEQEIKLKEKKIAEAMVDAKDAERSEIGRELHDNINQLLGVSKLYLDMAKRGGENTETNLSRSSEYTLQAIEEIRKLTKGLTNDIIKNFGLCEAIENIVEDTMQVNPVKIATALDSFIEDNVSEKFKVNIYRIIQEQLNNILKHAHATEVKINLSENNEFIILIITDNGVGFDTSKKRKGIGVDNIKNRASSYNGNADFVSQPGQGCILTVTFPAADQKILAFPENA